MIPPIVLFIFPLWETNNKVDHSIDTRPLFCALTKCVYPAQAFICGSCSCSGQGYLDSQIPSFPDLPSYREGAVYHGSQSTSSLHLLSLVPANSPSALLQRKGSRGTFPGSPHNRLQAASIPTLVRLHQVLGGPSCFVLGTLS